MKKTLIYFIVFSIFEQYISSTLKFGCFNLCEVGFTYEDLLVQSFCKENIFVDINDYIDIRGSTQDEIEVARNFISGFNQYFNLILKRKALTID